MDSLQAFDKTLFIKLIVNKKNIFRLIADHCDKKQNTLSEKDVNLLPPISNIDKVLGVGLNYSSYCTDNNLQPPTCPIVFSRFSSNIIGPHDDIHLPTMSSVGPKIYFTIHFEFF